MQKANSIVRLFLLIIIFMAVTADSALLPYYPRLFETYLEIKNPEIVGNYLVMLSVVVMLSMPIWVLISRKFDFLKLLIVSQIGAGLFAFLSVGFDMPFTFFLFSLLMVMLKASYLLIYPFILENQEKEMYAKTIQIFTVLIYLGGVLGAILGGGVIDSFPVQNVFYVMGSIDFIQAAICIALILYFPKIESKRHEDNTGDGSKEKLSLKGKFLVISAGILMFYIGSFAMRPFFVEYWSKVSPSFNGSVISGLVYAIPAVMALCSVYLNSKNRLSRWRKLHTCLLILSLTSFLQTSDLPILIIVSRIVFGWALFQASVSLEWLAYTSRDVANHKGTYVVINYAQNIGVIIAYYLAGWGVKHYDSMMPLLLSAVFFLVLFFVFYIGRKSYAAPV